MDIEPEILPDTPARAILDAKPVVSRQIFDALLPELKARVFMITGIACADTLQRARDAIGQIVTDGRDWKDARGEIEAMLRPFLGDGARRRAEFLVRFHVYQMHGVGRWNRLKSMRADFPYMQYVTAKDERVRGTHRALHGLVMPADHPFVQSHWAGWEPGCRCTWVALTPEDYDELVSNGATDMTRDAAGRPLIPTGPVLDRLEQAGFLFRGAGPGMAAKEWDVRTPRERSGPDAWHNDPEDMGMPLSVIMGRWDPQIAATFEANARALQIPGLKMSVWQWLGGGSAPLPPRKAPKPKAPKPPKQPQAKPAAAELSAGPGRVNFNGLRKAEADELSATVAAHLNDFPGLENHLQFAGTIKGRKAITAADVEAWFQKMRPIYQYMSDATLRAYAVKAVKKVNALMPMTENAHYLIGSPEIRINVKTHKDRAAYLKQREDREKSGFAPPGVQRYDASLIHEMGHALDYWLKVSARPGVAGMWNKGRAWVETNVSGYAATNIREMIAEAWLEYRGSAAPRPAAIAIGKEIEAAYAEWKASQPNSNPNPNP